MIPCHHPIVHKTLRQLWTLLVKNVGIAPKELLVGSDVDDIIATLQRALESGPDKLSSVKTSIQTLASVHPDGLVPKLVDIFIGKLDRNEIQISDTDFEIYQTPGIKLVNFYRL